MKIEQPFQTKPWSKLLGGTEPGQRVTPDNIHYLPPGAVIRNGDQSRIIHLHGELWLWCCDGAHVYDDVDRMKGHLDKDSVLCHHP